MTQDWSCLVRVCETLLARMNLKQWQAKRRLFTIFNNFDNDLKAKVNTTYLYLGRDADIQADNRDVGKIFPDLLECWVKGAIYPKKRSTMSRAKREAERLF